MTAGKRALAGLSWIISVPAILLAVTHNEAGRLALGAFGPPATYTLETWLLIGVSIAGFSAMWIRSRPLGGLTAAALISFGLVSYRERGISIRDVTFAGTGINISATIYEPRTAGVHAAVVLVHGSSPLKRGFYSVWAERLVQSGMVVIVPDKRGVGGTGGMFERNNNTSKANLELLAGDVVSALDYAVTIPSVDSVRLGLFGLSQAGWVAPMAALRSSRARFLLLITSPTVSVREEALWSDLRGDDQQDAKFSLAVAESVMDTAKVGGVDARTRLGALSIPGLWLFGRNDNSIPTRKSVAVLDSLHASGKPYTAVVFPETGHLLFTRAGSLLPHIAPASWDSIDRWLTMTVNSTR